MNKGKLIKKAINQRVIIEDRVGDKHEGWLVVEGYTPNHYMLLPFSRNRDSNDSCEILMCFSVSHIKHISYILNGCRLW